MSRANLSRRRVQEIQSSAIRRFVRLGHGAADGSRYNAPPVIVSASRGIVRPTVYRERLAIVGGGPTADQAPLSHDSWEVWGLNHIALYDRYRARRADRWFEIHETWVADDLAWLRAVGCPVYMIEPHPEIPGSVAYPQAMVYAAFRTSYFSCTMTYQLALAAAEGRHSEVGLYGIDLGFGTARERLVEKAGVEYWIGMLRGMGVRVTLPEGSRLAHHRYRYGIDYKEEKAEVERMVADVRALADDRGLPRAQASVDHDGHVLTVEGPSGPETRIYSHALKPSSAPSSKSSRRTAKRSTATRA